MDCNGSVRCSDEKGTRLHDNSPDMNAIQDRIIREFNSRKDWFDKYDYLIASGKAHPHTEDELKSDRYAMYGCQSRVWIRATLQNGRIRFDADSDAVITRGMLALVLQVLNDQPPHDVARAELYFISRTGLDQNLSPSRANGLNTLVAHMQGLARQIAQGHATDR